MITAAMAKEFTRRARDGSDFSIDSVYEQIEKRAKDGYDHLLVSVRGEHTGLVLDALLSAGFDAAVKYPGTMWNTLSVDWNTKS